MLKNEIKLIIQQFFKSLKLSMRRVKKDLDSAAIHDFRVDVKKLRSFVRLLALEPKCANDLKLPKKLKELYTYCGKIRDMQLQLLRMKEDFKDGNVFDKFETPLKSEMKQWMKELYITLRYRPLLEAENKLKSKIPRQLQPGSIQSFFKQSRGNIQAIIAAGTFKDDELHNIRKKIKDIIYINKLLKAKAFKPVKAMQWNKAEIKRVELLAHDLGRYNDCCVALSFLKSDILKVLYIEDQRRIQLTRKKWNQEKMLKRKKLIACLLSYRF